MDYPAIFPIDTNFEYIIRKSEPQKICFGSGQSRDTSRNNLNFFMRYYTAENYSNVGPGSYNVLKSFNAIKTKPCCYSISKRGYSGLARFAKPITYNTYMKDYISSSDYAVPKQIKTQKYPFLSTNKKRIFDTNKNPGPGTYNGSKEIKGIIFEHSFGSRVKMQLGVDFKCCNRNTNICKICGKTPTGDYWHLNNKIFLCRTCMIRECQEQTKFKRKKLELFRKIRTCSSIHIHEGTDAKIWLIHPIALKQWTRRETYLSAYLKD
ncbi:PREDICTED: uncharacterized protein LOC108777415 [Cyphomyrmex costatus]|uniref:Uncharacterized protein n=1 Tax=Cyphomyrmex costatus TaxID=456900 RepID=A0A195CCK0_9HYME|nr:PREDICTED: uncharacterized protein LOC108777415 [Cyphomyrmex costatus]KYM98584.1 hypothetical protein ALC62_10552 [Cyphomyrmex costatus]